MIGRKTLDSILSGFNKTLDELQKLQNENTKVVQTNCAKVASLNLDSDERLSENKKAATVQAKIADLISVE